MMACADIAVMSSKDGLVNIGGFCSFRDDQDLLRAVQERCVVSEAHHLRRPRGRDMETPRSASRRRMDADYLRYCSASVAYLGERLRAQGIPIQYPTGGHAVFVDAADCCRTCRPTAFQPMRSPLRAVPGGGRARGGDRPAAARARSATGLQEKAPLKSMRLTIPRRVYTNDHMDYVADAMAEVARRAARIRGMAFTYEPALRATSRRVFAGPETDARRAQAIGGR